MDWSYWSDVSFWAVLWFLFAAFVFVFYCIMGFAVIITPLFVDYVIREMGGLKGLVGRLGWLIGASLAKSGGMGVLVSILFVVIGLFIEVNPDSMIGRHPSLPVAVLVVCAFR